MIKVVFFDLFFTLVVPAYHQSKNENDVLGLSIAEWHNYCCNGRNPHESHKCGVNKRKTVQPKRVTPYPT